MKKILIGMSLTALAFTTLSAAEKIGDMAPPLTGVEIVQVACPTTCVKADTAKVCPDTAVKTAPKTCAPEFKVDTNATVTFYPGKVYVVECWATWCPPCVASIPHLTKLQKAYGDKVTILGVSVDAKADAVQKFLADEKKPKFGYNVLHDTNRNVSKNYMEAFDQKGIPCSFIIDKEGKIAWVGHPMKLDDELKKIVEK